MNNKFSLAKGHSVICEHCKSEMYLDSIECDFNGNQNEYWRCSECNSFMVVEIRNGKEFNRYDIDDIDDFIEKYGLSGDSIILTLDEQIYYIIEQFGFIQGGDIDD